MADLRQYKCPNCGGYVEFDSTIQKMKCPFCDSVFEVSDFLTEEDVQDSHESGEDISADEAADEPLAGSSGEAGETATWECESEQVWSESELEGMMVYHCDSCSGEIIGDANMGATRCPYCGNNVVIREKFAGGLKPDYLIPFVHTAKEAEQHLEKHIRSYRFAPASFYDRKNLSEVKGIYVPFWLFDSSADFNCTYEGTRMGRRWRDGDYNCQEIEHYLIRKKGYMDFQKIPADGSRKMDDQMMDSLEPFDMSAMVPFASPYLAGFWADRYDVAAEENQKRVDDRVYQTVETEVNASVQGFQSISRKHGVIEPHGGKASYALLPVWMLTMKWKDQTYTYAMNGQTGKIVGTIPFDGKAFRSFLLSRSLIYGLAVAAIAAVITII